MEEDSKGEEQAVMEADAVDFGLAKEEFEILQRTG